MTEWDQEVAAVRDLLNKLESGELSLPRGSLDQVVVWDARPTGAGTMMTDIQQIVKLMDEMTDRIMALEAEQQKSASRAYALIADLFERVKALETRSTVDTSLWHSIDG